MTKNLYKVAFIREGREEDYREFWNRSILTNSQGEALTPEVVGIYQHLEAKTLEDAIAQARNNHPKLIIAREHCAKIA